MGILQVLGVSILLYGCTIWALTLAAALYKTAAALLTNHPSDEQNVLDK